LTDPANIKRRFKVMIVGDTIAMLAAAVLAYGYFARGVQWMLPAFVAALVGGFAVQIWFIAGLGRADKGV
jgi:hypothetical protein